MVSRASDLSYTLKMPSGALLFQMPFLSALHKIFKKGAREKEKSKQNFESDSYVFSRIHVSAMLYIPRNEPRGRGYKSEYCL